MSTNPYLDAQRSKFDALTVNVRSITDKAAAESRDLSETELRSVTEQNESARALADQINSLTEAETRAAAVAKVAGEVTPKDETRAFGSTRTQDRDPGHYRSATEGGSNSYFADQFRSQTNGDREAGQRLTEYNRAVTVSSGGTGIVPPKWLLDEYMPLARQTRVVANAVRRLALGSDPRPLVLPKALTGVDANIVTQSAEGANTAAWGVDRYTSGSDTLTPVTRATYQDVSRQLLNSSDPAVDSIIYGDIRSAWDAMVETYICAAIIAGGTASGSTFATEAAFSTGAVAIDAVVDAQTAVSGDQRGPADLAIMNFRRFGAYRKLKDTTNRPLMPVSRYGPQNATGALDNVLSGDIEGVDVVGTAGVPTAYAEKYAVLRRNAVILAESDLLEFTFTEVVGPSSVRLGVWGYLGALVRNPNSVAVLTVTGA